MPEGPEVTILGQFLFTKLEGRIIEKMEILSGKYSRKPMNNHTLLNGNTNYLIKNIDSKGKLMWITLENIENNNKIYLVSHLGLTGFWGFTEGKNDRLKFTISDTKNNKKYSLYFEDDRNFGNIDIYDDRNDLDDKINELAPDALKHDFTTNDFAKLFKNYLSKSPKRKEQEIGLALMKQKQNDGVISGIGNYLMAEILYDAKLSPYRKAGSLTEDEIYSLCKSIKYITKLSYYDNETGYMTHFDEFIKIHKKGIDKGIYPEFHIDIKLKKNEKFDFKVYRQDKDSDGNEVLADKKLQKTRSTYWTPAIQK
jgi:formamidopyrimidine-DNA glycosylase